MTPHPHGRVALVTGANKGLGRELSLQLAHLGHAVIVAARDEAAAQRVVDDIRAQGGHALALKLDVTSTDDIARAAQHVEQTFGKLDLLINNAGVALEWDERGTTPDRFRQTLEVNLIAPWAVTEALVPLLAKSDDARVIHHSGVLGSIGTCAASWPQLGHYATPGYATSKAGLNMLTVIQSNALAPKNIAVAAAHPGWAKTDLGGPKAPMTARDAVKTALTLATMPRDQFPHGQLLHNSRRLPW